jgi:hypothetical protein
MAWLPAPASQALSSPCAAGFEQAALERQKCYQHRFLYKRLYNRSGRKVDFLARWHDFPALLLPQAANPECVASSCFVTKNDIHCRCMLCSVHDWCFRHFAMHGLGPLVPSHKPEQSRDELKSVLLAALAVKLGKAFVPTDLGSDGVACPFITVHQRQLGKTAGTLSRLAKAGGLVSKAAPTPVRAGRNTSLGAALRALCLE